MTKGDKEKYRVEAAIAAMRGVLCNERSMQYLADRLGEDSMEKAVAYMANGYADALMKELGLDKE